MTIENAVGRCILMLRHGLPNLRRATVFLSPRMVVKATRQCKADRRSRRDTFIVTIGAPNYREREWIKLAKRANEPFPVRKVQLTAWPTARKRKKP